MEYSFDDFIGFDGGSAFAVPPPNPQSMHQPLRKQSDPAFESQVQAAGASFVGSQFSHNMIHHPMLAYIPISTTPSTTWLGDHWMELAMGSGTDADGDFSTFGNVALPYDESTLAN
ncbi:hypothetical protein B0A55_03740 [Friedmanniomyces simplex]|uniref:Uncharacterized protein n=1 Tax=Friedmanniomyces simplex TaxID=329884 RepID=A0A4U0XH13_9PEZI|nr:hypothetical protein B0A55_03740 [Friedmanniomyces simplex]